MSLASGAALAVSIALTAVLVWSAISDIRTRRIPNAAVISVIGLYVLWAIVHSGQGLPGALAASGMAFVVCFAMYIFKVWGAGDAKLFVALALFTGLNLLLSFAVTTALAGGLMVLARLAVDPGRAFLAWHMRGRLNDGRGVPYGVAIALGALIIHWGAMYGLLPAVLLLTPGQGPRLS